MYSSYRFNKKRVYHIKQKLGLLDIDIASVSIFVNH